VIASRKEIPDETVKPAFLYNKGIDPKYNREAAIDIFSAMLLSG